MPAFTAIGIAVATWATGATFATVGAAMAAGAWGFVAAATVASFGAAFITSRLINGSPDGGGSGGAMQDPGVRTQLPPATSNKIPVVYGSANTKGVITDARLSSSDGNTNDTMTYVLTLSEQTQSGTFTIGDMYWNDSLLVFGTGADNYIVKSSIDQGGDGTTSTNFADLIKIRVYSGDASTSTSQIFPTTNKVSAISVLGESDTNYKMSGLVYAVVQIKYNGEKGVTGLADMTFQLQNTLKNPGLVWYDYMSSTRYGAGIDLVQLDTVSSISTATTTSLYNISNQIPANQFTTVNAKFDGSLYNFTLMGPVDRLTVTSVESGTITAGDWVSGPNVFSDTYTDGGYAQIGTQISGTTGGVGVYNITAVENLDSNTTYLGPFQSGTKSDQVRYQINGVISPGDTIKNNIDRISQNSAAWTTYDYVTGLWKVIPNRRITANELSTTFEFDDDNIIGEVTITATDLESLYNSLEVEFANRVQRDQVDYFRSAIALADRNELEPDNTLSMRLDLVNNAIHGGRIGQIELLQSRIDLVINFKADHSALQVEAGDIIRVTNEVYGFDEKIFRVTRTREVESDEGGLMAEITALEYSAGVYADQNLEDYAAVGGSGIPVFGGAQDLPAPSAPVISAVNTSTNSPNFTISTTIGSGSGSVDLIEWWYSSTAGGTYAYLTNEHGDFAANQTVNDVIFTLGSGTWYFKARAASASRYSDFSAASASFTWAPTPGGASNGSINTSTFSSQINVLTTSGGAAYIPMVSASSGFQPVYADADLTYSPAPNTLNIAGVAAGISFTNTGTKITSPMSLTGPLMFQSNTTNGISYIGVQPNGTAATGGVSVYGQSDTLDAQTFRHGVTANTEVFFNSTRNGATKTLLPMNFYAGGGLAMSITTATRSVAMYSGTQATTSATGALIIPFGGIGVGGNIFQNGIHTIANATNATSTQTGALQIVNGGAGIGGNVVIGGTLNAPGTYHCEVARSSNTATSTSTDVIVYWNKTNSDPFGWLTNFTQIKPNVAGYYMVHGQANFQPGVGTGQINTQIRKNGSTFALAQHQQPTTVGAGLTQNVVGIVQLNGSTDYIDMSTYSSSSNGQTISGDAAGAWTKLLITKLQ